MDRAAEILNSPELKQAICNQILGASFKDVEKAMESLLENRQPDRDEEETDEPIVPSQSTINAIIPKKKVESRYRPPTRAEVQALLEASRAPIVPDEGLKMPKDYPTLSREEAERLVREHYE